MRSQSVIVLFSVALMLSACGQRDTSHTSSVNPAFRASASDALPPAPPERGPIPPNANAAAPGTNASEAFANEQLEPAPKQPPADGAVQPLSVEAEDAAARARETPPADAAKREVVKEGSRKPAS